MSSHGKRPTGVDLFAGTRGINFGFGQVDFIGNQRSEFRFDQRFNALFGGTRQQVIREIETGITRLPGNCYFRLDKESRKVILENLKAQLKANRAWMVAELKVLANQLRRRPSLSEYLSETHYDLADLYKTSVGDGTHFLTRRNC